MNQPRELDIPLDRTIRTLHIICNESLLDSGNDEQARKRLFESTIPTPNTIPKAALTWIKLDMPPKILSP
jgi:hypothetical protein